MLEPLGAHVINEQWISVLRQPKGLVAIINGREESFTRPSAEDSQSLDLRPYREEVRPLADVLPGKSGPLVTLPESWESLAVVTRFDAQTLYHVLNILIHTLPGDSPATDVAALKIEPPPAPPQPTAAHPRAFRGTKTQPPKPRHAAPIDLRPHLCVPQNTNRLLSHLAPQLAASLQLLQTADILPPEQLPRLADAHGGAVDVYLECCHQAGRQSLYALPPAFRRSLLYWLRGMPWSAVGRALALYWSVELESHSALLCAVSRLLALSPAPAALDWCELLQHIPPHRRVALAELMIETRVAGQELPQDIAAKILCVDRETADDYFRHRMFVLLRWIARGGDLDYLMAGFHLANRYWEGHDFDDVEGATQVSLPALDALAEHLDHPAEPEGWSRVYAAWAVWEHCPELPGLAEIALDPRWLRLDAEVAAEVLCIFANLVYHELNNAAKKAKWKVLRGRAAALLDLLLSLPPEYRAKCQQYLHDIVWRWDDPDRLAVALDRYRKLLPRLCQPPFATETRPDPLGALSGLTDSPWQTLLDAPDALFLKLERAARRENDALLLASGLTVLARLEGTRLTEWLCRHPSPLFRAAKTLGGVPKLVQQEILGVWREHPLFSNDVAEMPVERLVDMIDASRSAADSPAVPKKLRDHVQGSRRLAPGQLERARRLLLDNLDAVRLDLLYRLTLERLARGLDVDQQREEARHAVQFLGYVDGNRRALRTFLGAYFRGKHDYLRDHPLNRAWLTAHPRIKEDVWTTGIRLDRELPDGIRVELAVERSPLEVLRLGTYVGSCLGLGGICAYSAVAVALDMNKRVVYARNSGGAVVARQVLAISDAEELVCFEVYPYGTGKELKQWFAEYDRAFAEVLGLAIHDPHAVENGGPSSDVALLLATNWWDDSAWDLRDEW